MKTNFFAVLLLLLPFIAEAGCSGNKTRDEGYFARPLKNETGTVTGVITTIHPGTVVTLQNDKAVFTTHADPLTGQFAFKEVQSGTYTLNVYLPGIEKPWSMAGLIVTAGENTDAGLITPSEKDPIQGSWLTRPTTGFMPG